MLQKKQSEFEYFRFEEDFVEENVRCIPMIVRFKLDAVGIKLKLSEWSKFNVEERRELAVRDSNKLYRAYVEELIDKYCGTEATLLEIEKHPAWADVYNIAHQLDERAQQVGMPISIVDWRGLTNLQRFALLKLCRPGHESKNFIKALKEFNVGG
jgi:hypothetical protein